MTVRERDASCDVLRSASDIDASVASKMSQGRTTYLVRLNENGHAMTVEGPLIPSRMFVSASKKGL